MQSKKARRKKKILEICNFSAGVTGTWTRVFNEAKELAKDYEVHVFSSDLKNGKKIKRQEKEQKVKIKRFPVKMKIGYALFFNFYNEAVKLNPDIIICHGFRKPYLSQALKVKKAIEKKKKIKIFLVTHAPFVEKGLRNWKLQILVNFYDRFYSKKILKSFDKIFAITKWEIPYLISLGAKKERIKYLPNGIPEKFFKKKRQGRKNKILFFSRISPLKDLETLIKACSKTKKYHLDITGPASNIEYLNKIKNLANKLNVKVKFNPPVYNENKKIKKIDSCQIFVLPSKREGLPLSILEAMARRKIVISSDTKGGKELINNNENGLIFKKREYEALAKKLKFCLSEKNKKEKRKIRKNAFKTAKEYSWEKVIKKLKREINHQ